MSGLRGALRPFRVKCGPHQLLFDSLRTPSPTGVESGGAPKGGPIIPAASKLNHIEGTTLVTLGQRRRRSRWFVETTIGNKGLAVANRSSLSTTTARYGGKVDTLSSRNADEGRQFQYQQHQPSLGEPCPSWLREAGPAACCGGPRRVPKAEATTRGFRSSLINGRGDGVALFVALIIAKSASSHPKPEGPEPKG